MPGIRILGAIVVGLIAGVVIITLVEFLGYFVHPFPEGFDLSDREAMKEHAAQAPPLARSIVVVAWVLGSLVGSFLAARLNDPGHHWFGLATGGILFVGVIVSLFQYPSGLGMMISGLTLPPLASLLAVRLAMRPPGERLEVADAAPELP